MEKSLFSFNIFSLTGRFSSRSKKVEWKLRCCYTIFLLKRSQLFMNPCGPIVDRVCNAIPEPVRYPLISLFGITLLVVGILAFTPILPNMGMAGGVTLIVIGSFFIITSTLLLCLFLKDHHMCCWRRKEEDNSSSIDDSNSEGADNSEVGHQKIPSYSLPRTLTKDGKVYTQHSDLSITIVDQEGNVTEISPIVKIV
jgi:hypothetical protein